MTIQQLIMEVNDLTKNMFREDYNIYMKFNNLFPYIHKYYQELIGLIPTLKSIGLGIDSRKVLDQLRGLSEAIEKRDTILLFDTLHYEVTDTLNLFKEIKEIMEQE